MGTLKIYVHEDLPMTIVTDRSSVHHRRPGRDTNCRLCAAFEPRPLELWPRFTSMWNPLATVVTGQSSRTIRTSSYACVEVDQLTDTFPLRRISGYMTNTLHWAKHRGPYSGTTTILSRTSYSDLHSTNLSHHKTMLQLKSRRGVQK